MKFAEFDGLGPVSRIGLGTWQFGAREQGDGDAGDARASGASRDALTAAAGALRPVSIGRFAADTVRERLLRR